MFEDKDLNFDECSLQEVIVTPEINLWEITLRTPKDFDEKNLRGAEEFLQSSYQVTVEFKPESLDESVPAEKTGTRDKGKVARDKGQGISDKGKGSTTS